MSYTPGAMTVGIEPHLFVVFGGTGDLARTKLIPAVYELLWGRRFDDAVEVLAVATSDHSDEDYRRMAREALADVGVPDAAEWCDENLHYQSISDGYEALARRIDEIERASGLGGNRIFYLAVPPGAFGDTVEGLGKAGLTSGRGWTRVVVEKPFGTDESTAGELNALLHRWFDERQIYRIDHYLAKETVQNLLALRFANPLFESSWNRDRIDSIQITVAEDIGIGSRAKYYDGAGAMRDIIQNHALQILSLVAMEPPVRLGARCIRDEKVKVLQSTYRLDPSDVVRGQYEGGIVEGSSVAGYRDEADVPDDSVTETYVAARFVIDNWRWMGVPFYVRSGKRLTSRVTQVSVVFKDPPVCLFEVDPECQVHPNVFDIRLQPREGFDLGFEMKTPGEGYRLHTQHLRFRYQDEFGELPGAYVTLLADVMTGDQTLFVRSDEVEEAWRLVAPVLDRADRPEPYPAGSWGPPAADRMLAGSGRRWQVPTSE